ncbi:protein ALTERED PHOSPHATE STARVATION RESPONSE 1-like isoform X2 [Impatiens glandulifera]|uniref:protein ALTERED PHOSPHATE STARVATION RESPONSE 1-like isoform X2 n=1 Tax=Impatiens glandulifera TaxID=253017 RepID=UPI001FB0B94B|nr:protein ALTERED PHOSPHATE STARVATION RESPONSE 1-like isoform X2 [Impatiens glandulifera]
MGCATSKHDDLPAVTLCRDRCAFLEEAIRHRYSLADAHLAYMLSLKGVGGSLRRFFDQDLETAMPPPPPPPHLQKKGQLEPSGSPVFSKVIHHHNHSNSGSHLHLDSGSGSDSDDLSLHHHLSGNNSPFHSYGQINYTDFNVSYTKNNAATSVVYEQRPMIPETVYMGEFPSSSYPYPSANQNQNQSTYPYYGNFFNESLHNYSSTPVVIPPDASTSMSPPPPPPPQQQNSTWDFFNPFDSEDKYYQQYTSTSSRASGEVREVEGIPDLEDEEEGFQQEIVKEVQEDKKGEGGNSYSKPVVKNDSSSDPVYPARNSNSTENNPVEFEVHMVDKKVDKEEISGDLQGNTPAFNVRFSDDSEIVKEIETLFQRASESGHHLNGILEVGKMPYKKGVGYHHASSKLLHVTTPSAFDLQPSLSTENGGLDMDEVLGSGNLSSTLHKLYLWEKKLYNEVKVEEKMRVLHDNKAAKLERLIKRGAEPHKIEATRMLITNLSTKIRIAIQIVDKISVKINMSRDEELWPQLIELIHGLAKFWKSSLESLRGQCQAISQARKLDAIASSKQVANNLEVTLQLEYELLNWISRFSSWIVAQKSFVKSLNNWLMKCILYVPEETPDGIVPFSPGRIGAPSIFVICFQWAQAMERISEKEVVDSMRDCARSVVAMRNNNANIGYKDLEKDDRKIQKEIQALDKRLVSISGGQLVYQADTSNTSSGLQISLKRTFETMERFTSESLSAYEELLLRVDEKRQDYRLDQENDEKAV